jgi:hypothetical protein
MSELARFVIVSHRPMHYDIRPREYAALHGTRLSGMDTC